LGKNPNILGGTIPLEQSDNLARWTSISMPTFQDAEIMRYIDRYADPSPKSLPTSLSISTNQSSANVSFHPN
jgi:hypothetical protein